jgi:hypothetical protein
MYMISNHSLIVLYTVMISITKSETYKTDLLTSCWGTDVCYLVWVLENNVYNNKRFRSALRLTLWNGTIHKALSLYINIYRYKTIIIKTIL